MRRFKMPFIAVFIMATLAITLFTPAPNIVKIFLIAAALVGLVWASWGNHLFTKAATIIKKKDTSRMNEAIGYLERAIKAGMGDQNMLVAGSLVVQYGDADLGADALLELTNNKKRDVRCNAETSLSMYYWGKKDLDKAIELVEKARNENWRHTNFFINSATYYLEKGDEKSFRRTINDAKKANAYSVPLMDLEAASELEKGNVENAGILLTKLFDITPEPVFMDPYVHMAIVYLNYGELAPATKMMKKALGTQFSNTSIIKEETIRKWVEMLESDERLDIADALKSGIRTIIERNELEIKHTGRKCTADKIEGYPEMPSFKINDDELPPEMRGYEAQDGDSCVEANTELNDDDEEWLRRHEHDND